MALYAVKHNPFAYFRSIQEATSPLLSLHQTHPFIAATGLYADLASAMFLRSRSSLRTSATISMDVAMRARSAARPDLEWPAVWFESGFDLPGDVTVEQLVDSDPRISAWKHGKNAIVLLWMRMITR